MLITLLGLLVYQNTDNFYEMILLIKIFIYFVKIFMK